MFKRKHPNQQTRKTPAVQPTRNVFTYHSSNRSISENTSRKDAFDQETKKSNRSLKHIPSYLALAVILVSIAYSLIVDTNNPNIVALSETTPSILRSNDEYKSGVAEIIDESISSKTKLSINTKNIENKILEAYPELSQASVNMPILGKRLIVQISPSTPSLIVTGAKGSYIVGSNGKALMKKSDLPVDQLVGLTQVNDALSDDIEIGKVALPLDAISFINNLQYLMKQKGSSIDSIQFPATANELHVKLDGQAYVIKYNLQNDVSQQTGSYFALTEHLASQKKALPAEYVDVRIDGRTYYK